MDVAAPPPLAEQISAELPPETPVAAPEPLAPAAEKSAATPPEKVSPPASAAPTPAAEKDWSEALTKSPFFETQPEAPTPVEAAPTDPWVAALKFVHDGFGAQECWLFLPKKGGESLPLVQGIGKHWQEFKKSAALRLDERTVFGVCLTRRENVVIHDTTAATLTPYLPAWFRKTEGAPGAFLLMPLHENKVTHGLVLIGWSKAQRINVSPAQTELARTMFASLSASHRANTR